MFNEAIRTVSTPELATIKSAAAGLAPDLRKFILVAVKLVEIYRLMEYVKDMSEAVSRVNSEKDHGRRRAALMELIMPHMGENMKTMMTMMEMFSAFK
ncbi:MAG: hypothetical protein FWC95_01180 [Defluviitaleaceae bacterium]|nr:hypothetical protein [Defluviitaleaceae bacterium]